MARCQSGNEMSRAFFAYLLRCADNSYYVGHTDDLERRFGEHREGGYCRYTEVRRPVELIWSQEFTSRYEALTAERQIKSWSRSKKESLAKGDFGSLKEGAKKKDWESYRRRRELSR